MRKKLLSSFIFIATFWYVALYFSWYVSLESVGVFFSDLFSFSGIPSIGAAIAPIEISFLYWVLPVFAIVVLSFLVGVVFAIVLTIIPKKIRAKKLQRKTDWRGIGISIGELPTPDWKVDLNNYSAVGIKNLINEKLQVAPGTVSEYKGSFKQVHEKILTDILFFIWQNKSSAFVGRGHGVDLYEHSISVLKEAWTPNCDPLIPIAAAAHDAGKVLAYKKHEDTNEWERLGFHDDYGMLFVAALDSFDALNEDEKLILKITIGYGHKENKRPILEKNIEERVQKIFAVINKADRLKTDQEKQKVIEKDGTPSIITNAFLKAVSEAPFQTPTTKRGSQSICFRKENIVYLLEPGFRDLFLNQLPEDLSAAFGDGFRRIGNMSPPTVALINHLKKLGWLVEEGNGMTSECGLWSVEIGRKVFNGVLAVKLPENITQSLPENSVYDVRFSCPLKVDHKKQNQPKDRIPNDQMTTLQKKARQLSALTGQSVESLLAKLVAEEAEIINEKNLSSNIK